MKFLWIYLLGVNLITWVLYGVDKRRAVRKQWRIPEKTLLGMAFLGGSIGALAGMQMFHHKTRHWKFRICVPVFLVLQCAVFYFCFKKGFFFSLQG